MCDQHPSVASVTTVHTAQKHHFCTPCFASFKEFMEKEGWSFVAEGNGTITLMRKQ